MIKSSIILLCCMAVGCVSAKVSEPSACDSKSMSWEIPNLPPQPAGAQSSLNGQSYTIPPTSTTQSFDLSSTLSKVMDIASNVHVGINELTLDNSNAQFDWVDSVSVTMTSPPLASMLLADYTVTNRGESIDLLPSLVATPDQVLTYFQNGPVTLTVTLGNMTGTVIDESSLVMLHKLNGKVTAGLDVCISISADFNKSL